MQQGCHALHRPRAHSGRFVTQACVQGRELPSQQLSSGLVACIWVLQASSSCWPLPLEYFIVAISQALCGSRAHSRCVIAQVRMQNRELPGQQLPSGLVACLRVLQASKT